MCSDRKNCCFQLLAIIFSRSLKSSLNYLMHFFFAWSQCAVHALRQKATFKGFIQALNAICENVWQFYSGGILLIYKQILTSSKLLRLLEECAEHASYISVCWKTRIPNLSDKILHAQAYLAAAFVWQEWSDSVIFLSVPFHSAASNQHAFPLKNCSALGWLKILKCQPIVGIPQRPSLQKSVHMAKWHASPALQKVRVSWLEAFHNEV